MTTLMDDSPRRFTALEGLRGYMAWWVVANHAVSLSGAGEWFPQRLVSFLSSSERAVDEFMILSGFVITHLILTRPEPYRMYLRRRAWRILPIYLVSLAIAWLLTPQLQALHTAPWVELSPTWLAGFQALQSNQSLHLALHLSMLHGMVPDTLLPFSSWTILGPAWSLSLEWQFYLLAPLIVALLVDCARTRWATVAVLLGLDLLMHRLPDTTWRFPSMVLLPMHFFLIGMLTRVYMPRLVQLSPWWVLMIGALAGLVDWPHKLQLWIWAICVAVMTSDGKLVWGGTGIGVARWLMSNKVAATLGRASYSTYLIHIPLIALTVWLGSRFSGSSTTWITQISTAIAVVLVVPLSLLLYRHIEQFFVRIGARRAG